MNRSERLWFHAIRSNDINLVRTLLTNNQVDIDWKEDKKKQTGLELAVAAGREELALLLLSKGASAPHDLLHAVVSGKSLDLLRALLDRDTSGINEYHSIHCTTPFQNACYKNKIEAVDVLLEYGADMNKSIHALNSPFGLALTMRNFEIVLKLLKLGADIHYRDHEGNTLLHFANDEQLLRTVGFDVIDVNVVNHRGETPLSKFAADGICPIIAQIMIDAGAHVDMQDIQGRTPLMHVSQDGKVNTAKLLIANGADVTIKDSSGMTSLHYAVRSRSEAMIKALVESGADINAAANDGRTPLDVAYKELHGWMSQCLIELGATESQKRE